VPPNPIIQNTALREIIYAAPSTIHGTGIFAKRPITKGHYIGSYHGPQAKRNGTYVLWVYEDADQPIGYSGKNLLRYLNHHKNCNAEFDGLALYSLKDILSDEEITFDYGWEE